MRDTRSQEDIHCNQDYLDQAESVLNTANYAHRHNVKEENENNDGDNDEEGPVYDLASVQQRMYDARDPEFLQQHFLRFEIDRTRMVWEEDETSGERKLIRNKNLHVMKLTDIDCYLDGNRHLVRQN